MALQMGSAISPQADSYVTCLPGPGRFPASSVHASASFVLALRAHAREVYQACIQTCSSNADKNDLFSLGHVGVCWNAYAVSWQCRQHIDYWHGQHEQHAGLENRCSDAPPSALEQRRLPRISPKSSMDSSIKHM